MDRFLRFVASTILLVVVGLILFGGVAGDTPGPLVLLVAAALAVLAVATFRRPSGVTELRWAGPAMRRHEQHEPRGSLTSPMSPVGEVRPPSTRRQVAVALGRAERRQWLSSGWFAAGIGFCVLQIVLFGWVFAYDNDASERAWSGWAVLYPIMAHPMVGMAVIGAHQAVTRGRRDRTEELFEACPASAGVRTSAHLRCAWVPAAALAGFVVVMTLVAQVRYGLNGSIDNLTFADGLAAVVLGACSVALGVALGRWAPWRLVPMVVVVALVPVIVELGTLGSPHWSNLRQLSSWPQYPDHDLLFTERPVWWHLLWLAALGALLVPVAFARARADRSRQLLLTGVAIAVVAGAAGVAQTRPLSDASAARIASLVAQPELHQTCRSAERVVICAYRGYEGYLDRALANVAPVVAATPDSVRPVVLRQVYDGDLATLGPEVGDALARLPAGREDYVPLAYDTGYESTKRATTALRLTTAFAAIGLPARPSPDHTPIVIAGQARGVVALWLAARGLDARDAEDLASDHYNPDDHTANRTPTALDLGMAWPDPCYAGPSPVAWAAQDLAAARALIALPEDRVRDLLHPSWMRFTDPAASTDELLVAAGLNPVGPPDAVVAVPLECSW